MPRQSTAGHHPPRPVARLLVCVHTDLVSSTELQQKMGPREFQRLVDRHREIVREACRRFNGRIIDNPGDGYFLTFENASDAVAFALTLQRGHKEDPSLPRVRVGIHQGQVTETTGKEKAVEVGGMPVVIAKRIESLARPSQILLSLTTFDDARQYVAAEELGLGELKWMHHGTYRLKGIEGEIPIGEVGEAGVGPFDPPHGGRGDEDVVGGWRPAKNQPIPQRKNWILAEKLGEGAFGEVWRASTANGIGQRVFKFCFQKERVKALKREVRVFEFLNRELGRREDIAPLLEWNFSDPPPYWIEFAYSRGGNLVEWCDKIGFRKIDMSVRLELAAKVADALAAAHSVGVVHKDLKPSNILVIDDEDEVRVQLLDFGLGWIAPERLRQLRANLEMSQSSMDLSQSGLAAGGSRSGTLMYMAPELKEEKTIEATPLTDMYSLGVILYQLAAGSFQYGLWEGGVQIGDELLIADIKACTETEPQNRLASASELAQRLRSLPERRRNRRRELRERVAPEALRYLQDLDRRQRGRFRYQLSVLLLLLAASLGWLGWNRIREITLRRMDEVLSRQLEDNRAYASALAGRLETALEFAIRSVEAVASDPGQRLVDSMDRVRALPEWAELKKIKRNPITSEPEIPVEDPLMSTREWGDLSKVLVELTDEAIRQNLIRTREDSRSGPPPTTLRIYSWALSDEEGYLMARDPDSPQVIGKRFAFRDWYHGQGTGSAREPHPVRATHISEPFVSQSYENLSTIAISTPVKRDGDIVGVLLATVPLDDYLRGIRPRSAGDLGMPQSHPVIVDHRGILVAHPMNPIVQRFNRGEDPGLPYRYEEAILADLRHHAHAANGSTAFLDPVLGADGPQVVGAAEFRVGSIEPPWLVLFETSRERLLRPLTEIDEELASLRSIAGIMGLFIVALVALVLLVGRLRVAAMTRAVAMGRAREAEPSLASGAETSR